MARNAKSNQKSNCQKLKRMFFLRIHSLNPSLSSQENNTESEASSSSNPNPQNTVITINDPRIKTVNGTIHLYRNAPHPLPSTSHSSHDPLPLLPVERGTLLFVLAVPSRLTVEDFLRFCGIVADSASDIRIIRNDAVEDRYSVIVNFDDQKSADNFYRDVNGCRYPEGEVFHILFLDSVVYAESTEIAGTSHAESTELPTCPVCLERLDQDISGITATTCDHSFECSCISEWANSTCLVCHFCQEHSQKPACSICGISGIHWICIICGFVGCGRYKGRHALGHWKDTQHCYTLDLETQRVWDYVGATYVHCLNQSRSDDKLDKSKSRNKSNGEYCENLACTEDSSVNAAMLNSMVKSIVVEYSCLLESQLESQRQYFETLIEEAKGKQEQCISEAVEKAVASKMQDMHLQIESVIKEKKRVADSNEILVKNQNLWRNKIIEIEERQLIMDSAEHDNIAMENLENQSDSVSSVGKKPVRSTHSEVWEYFQKNEAIEGEKHTCYCKECKKTYIWGGKYGTSNLRKHISKCSLISLKALKENHTIFDQNKYMELMAKAIVRHNLPFMFVHYEGIREVFSYLNDKVVSFSKNTSRTDVLKLYEMEKSKLKCFLKTCSGRVSLTTDLWTSINTDGYITLTAHFIDDEWKLQKKLLSFCLMPPPHSGVAIFEKKSSLLRSWGIEDRIFAYTLDNASSNDKFVELLESHLLYRKALIANGEYLHVRCAAHILNLMVQDGLKCISSYLANIRESIKYIKGSQSRKKYFVQCIADLSLDNSNKGLCQDVPTRWNSTFIMLKSAIYYEQALCRLQLVDKNYVYYPTQEEWLKAKRIADFLEVFHDATCLFSGTKYPTSNLFFPKIVLVLFTLQRCMKSNDFMFEMASSMFLKFNKYWSEVSVLLCIACILDPRYKIDFVKFWYKRLYGNDYSERFEVVKMKLEDLYEEYKTKVEKECNNEASGSKNLDFSDSFMGLYSQECADVMEEFDTFRNSEIAYSSRNSELKLYLEDGFLDRKLPLDILSFWKSQQFKYPILSLMAKDVLAVSFTTVASESAFSISGRVLNDYHSSLKDDIVEALLCTRDWLYGNVSTMEVEQQNEDITKFHIDEEQSTQFPTLSLGDY